MQLTNNALVSAYISEVCSQIKFKEVHPQITLELENHILEKSEALIEKGVSEKEALATAIKDMGDSFLVGKELNKSHKGKPDLGIVISTSILVIVGLFVMYTIQSFGSIRYAPVFYRTLIFLIIGVAIATFIYFYGYHKLKKYSKALYIITAVFLIFMIFVNPYYKHSGIVAFFSSEAPLLFILALCGLDKYFDFSNIKATSKTMFVLFLPIFLTALIPSMASSLTYIVGITAVMLHKKLKKMHIAVFITLPFAFLTLFALTEPYRCLRLFTFLNPSKDSEGVGYIYMLIRKLISSTGLIGHGFIFPEKLMLPEAHTDFVLAYIIYTFGWLFTCILFFTIVFYLFRLLSITKIIKDSYGKLLIIGFTTVFAMKFIWNILMILGVAPIFGVSLPFISYGGSDLVANLVAIGIILSVYRRRTVLT